MFLSLHFAFLVLTPTLSLAILWPPRGGGGARGGAERSLDGYPTHIGEGASHDELVALQTTYGAFQRRARRVYAH